MQWVAFTSLAPVVKQRSRDCSLSCSGKIRARTWRAAASVQVPPQQAFHLLNVAQEKKHQRTEVAPFMATLT